MSKPLTEAEIKTRLITINRPEISIDYATYIGVNKKCRFVDAAYGEWWATPGNVLFRESRHPKRGHGIGAEKQKLSLSELRNRLHVRFGGAVDVDASTYVNTATTCRFIDKDYGEFWQRPSMTLTTSKGHPLRGHASIATSLSYTLEEVRHKVSAVWLGEVDILTYNGFNEKSLFRHRIYGDWEATPYNVLNGHNHPAAGRQKYYATMTSRYGKAHSMQIKSLHNKASKARANKVLLPHWKTGQLITCTASYEYAIVTKLNELKIDFETQIPFDVVVDGKPRVYFVDLYLPEQDKYIEIKGYFRELSKKKWEIFHKEHPNSELWCEKEVLSYCNKTAHELRVEYKALVKKQNEYTL